MAFPVKALAAGLLVWFALLMLLVMVRVLRGDIYVTGFLSSTAAGPADRPVDPERVLAMSVFPFVVIYYVLQALNADLNAVTERPTIPDIPDFLVTLLTGSNGLYLAGKIARR